MTRREFVGVKLSKPGLDAVRQVAAAEHDNNLSAAVRMLLAEALAARAKQDRP